MPQRRRSRPGSRRLTLLFLTVVVPPALTLVLLGWQVAQLDVAAAAQRQAERRQTTLLAVVHSLQRSLEEVERSPVRGPLTDGLVRWVETGDRLEADPINRVLWLPMPAIESPADRIFQPAEIAEFSEKPDQLAQALADYTAVVASPVPAMRAGALMRIGRMQAKARQWDAALATYRRLAAINNVSLLGNPADLRARRAICDVLAAAGRTADLAAAAAALELDFAAGAWTAAIDRPGWERTAADLEKWTGHPLRVPDNARLFSAVGETLWQERGGNRTSRRVIVADGVPVTTVRLLDRVTVVAIAPELVTGWIARATQEAPDPSITVSIAGAGGAPDVPVARASMDETALPWLVALYGGDSTATARELAARRRLFAGGLVAMLTLIAGASYFFWQVLKRELTVSRLQTEFVASVSHEFRTPLTSLAHVTSLLQEEGGLSSQEQRRFYDALARNTTRLHRLVESLLDFARMDAGRKPYALERVDARLLVNSVVDEMRRDLAPRGVTITVDDAGSAPLPIQADWPALSNAVSNLIDNAVKYSFGPASVGVSVRREAWGITIAVRDRGLGIPSDEQRDIFDRFVRGRQAIEQGISGTGLGLAIVSHVVSAHGGTVEVESAPGLGSTFTIVLPIAEATEAEPNIVETATASDPPVSRETSFAAGSRQD